MNEDQDERLIRIADVLEIIPVSRSTFWAWVRTGKFPAPIKLSAGVSCWRKKDVISWIDSGGVK